MVRIFSWQSTGKPGSVVNDHLSSLPVAEKIKRVATSASEQLYIAKVSLQQTGFTFTACRHAML